MTSSKLEYSAGAVIIKGELGKEEILLVKYANGKYGFPKGHLDGGETSGRAAIREVVEETGYPVVVLGGSIGKYQRRSIKRSGMVVQKEIELFWGEVSGTPNIAEAQEVSGWTALKDISMEMFNYAEDGAFYFEKVLTSASK